MINRKCSLGLFALAVVFSSAYAIVKVAPVNAQAASDKHADKLLRHVVMFQFKEGTSEADIKKVVDAFRELPNKIDGIVDFEYGTDNSTEKLADGFTHCFLVSFKSEDDRAKYLPHAAHQEFVTVLKPHLEKVLVIDYWASR